MTEPNHLVIVCGHGIWLGGPARGHDESEWLIESYKKGETPTFIAHIRDGVKVLSENDQAVLCFSGAPTRRETNLSEGESYRNVAHANSYFDLFPDGTSHSEISSRILVDDRALDSYYNILSSLVLFWRVHRVWPEQLTIVSHGFKRKRLVDLHCAAIGFPLHKVRFLGTDPEGLPSKFKSSAHVQPAAEVHPFWRSVVEAEEQWRADPHGVGEILAAKRRERNVWAVDQRLFADGEEGERRRVRTRFLDDGTETLHGIGPRPWQEAWRLTLDDTRNGNDDEGLIQGEETGR